MQACNDRVGIRCIILNILFWNLGKNDNSQYLAQCINERKIDFAILSEYENLNISYVLHKLNNKYRHIPGMGGCDKITMLALNDIDVHIQREQTRYAMYSVEKDGIDLIIVGTHLQDRRNSDSAQRISTAGRLMNDLENLEKRKQCKKSVIIGDLNANPYDEELLQMNAFHAVLFKDVIKAAETRTIGGIRYRRLYNPILHFLSEDTKNYGSYYNTQESSTPTWHCLDQILVSKALADTIKSLEYLRSIGNSSLIAQQKPKREISDHLPLFIQIEVMGEQ